MPKKKVEVRRLKHPPGFTSTVVDETSGIAWVLDPKHALRDRIVWELNMKGYNLKVIGELLGVSDNAIHRIKWAYHRRNKEREDHICDLCGKYDEDDVYWREGKYDLCSECWDKAMVAREIRGTSRYRAIDLEMWERLKKTGYTNKEIEHLVFKKGWNSNTPMRQVLKLENKGIEELVNEGD